MAELKFNFSDADTHSAEMSELYTYSEMDDFILNFEAFTQYMEEHDVSCTIYMQNTRYFHAEASRFIYTIVLRVQRR